MQNLTDGDLSGRSNIWRLTAYSSPCYLLTVVVFFFSRFRELSQGSGDAVSLGQLCSISYTLYKLNGLYLDSLGYGKEGKNDVGETLTFQYGGGQVPRAIELGMQGMQAGGKRRILVRPELGWISPRLLPLPTSSAAERRFNNNKRQPLLFEVELVKLKPAPESTWVLEIGSVVHNHAFRQMQFCLLPGFNLVTGPDYTFCP